MRRAFLAAVVWSTLAGAQNAGPDKTAQEKAQAALAGDPLLRAMAEELARAKNLRALGEAVYYADVSVDDAETFQAGATLGAAFAAQRNALRPIRVTIRVGSPAFDNTNSVYADYFSGTRYDPGRLPLDNTLPALRHALWLSFDRAYKTAFEALGRKSAALRGMNTNEKLADFWPAGPNVLIENPARARIDDAAWTARVKELSMVFAEHPEVTSSAVEVEFSQGGFYFLNTEGSVVRIPDRLGILRVRGALQAADGMTLYDGDAIESLDPARMPSDADLRRAVEAVAQNLSQLSRAPVGESYTGPVLFAGEAGAQIFAEVFGAQLGVTRRPVSEPGRTLPIPSSELDGRIGMRVLPEWFDAVDDPTLKEFAGRPLVGAYAVDLEGVAPQRLAVIERGVLKAVLTTRQPVRGMSGPNGRARLPGPFGVKIPRISNLIVQPSQTESEAALKGRLIDLARQQGRAYGILIRKMDFPSSGSFDDLRRRAVQAGRSGAGGRPVSAPVLVYRVYADGREELVRGLRLRSLTARQFRDIAAAGDRMYQFDYVDNGALLALSGASNYVVGCSVVAPPVLFEDLELETAGEDLPKPPVVPPPPLGAQN